MNQIKRSMRYVLSSMAIAMVTAVMVVVVAADAQERPLPDFNAFVAQVKVRLQTDADRQSGYTSPSGRSSRRSTRPDASRKRRSRCTRLSGLAREEPYRRLIEENGKPVPAPQLAKRDRDRQNDVEEYAQRVSTQSENDRHKAARDYQKAVRERTEAIDDIFNVFDVRMLARERVEGHDAIVFTLTPKRKVKPRTDSGKMMHHFTARAWISESDYELVRVQVEAIESVSFGLGLLARLHKGATATYQRRKVNGEAWLPALVTYAGSGRVLLVKGMRLGGMSDFSNYRRFGVETTTTLPAVAQP